MCLTTGLVPIWDPEQSGLESWCFGLDIICDRWSCASRFCCSVAMGGGLQRDASARRWVKLLSMRIVANWLIVPTVSHCSRSVFPTRSCSAYTCVLSLAIVLASSAFCAARAALVGSDCVDMMMGPRIWFELIFGWFWTSSTIRRCGVETGKFGEA